MWIPPVRKVPSGPFGDRTTAPELLARRELSTAVVHSCVHSGVSGEGPLTVMLVGMAPAPRRAFVDESIRGRTYLLAAVLVRDVDVRRSRPLISNWVLPGQRTIHFVSESHARRQQILQKIAGSPNLALRTATGDGKNERARADAMAVLIDALLKANVVDVTPESRGDARNAHDRQTLSRLLARRAAIVAFRHTAAHDEPLLWIADACAWSAGAGGRYAGPISTLLARP